MSNDKLRLKPINDLLKEKFFIPSYQRGYRWTPRQVTALLDDIFEFHRERDGQKKEAFYCLQPVVVMRRPDGDWELIDGQQRLTTVFLILTYLRKQMEAVDKTRYTLHYETRKGSGAFLENFDSTQIQKHLNDNIDYYHICKAYLAIEKWFSAKTNDYKLTITQCITADDELGRNVKVIWYELPDEETPVDVFIRLNIGKIPLTNAELIKALFLRSPNTSTDEQKIKRLHIAQEWDSIEKAFQSDDLWYFMHKGEVSYPTRIQYLFELITHSSPQADDLNKDDPMFIFLAYNRMFTQSGAKPDSEWLKVKQKFMICEEWHADRVLYHLIGYLVINGVSLLDIMKESTSCNSKSDFKGRLKNIVLKVLFEKYFNDFNTEDDLRDHIITVLSELSYESDKEEIRSALLLFNIATLLQNTTSKIRFPFDSYKKERWDIEHIRSVKSDKPNRVDRQKEWLENVIEYWTGRHEREEQKKRLLQHPDQETSGDKENELCSAAIKLLDAKTFDSTIFDQLYESILECFEEKDSSETDNSLANLALLDYRTNRSYKNAVFPIKRRRIIGLDKSGTFIPLCTTNVFLKYYSHKIDKMMFWSDADRTDYFNAIVDTLVTFFASENGGKA